MNILYILQNALEIRDEKQILSLISEISALSVPDKQKAVSEFMLPTEVWKPVKIDDTGVEVEVSNYGNIKNKTGQNLHDTGKFMRVMFYYQVPVADGLTITRRGTYALAKLLFAAFGGNDSIPKRFIYKDRDYKNCSFWNLVPIKNTQS